MIAGTGSFTQGFSRARWQRGNHAAGESAPREPRAGGRDPGEAQPFGQREDASPSAGLRILLVEDNPGDANLVREALVRADKRLVLVHVARISEAIERAREAAFDVVLLDLSLPDSFELAGARQLRAAFPDLPIVVLTALDDDRLAASAVAEGAQDYLVKGQIEPSLLVRSMRYAIERQQYSERARLLAQERSARIAAEAAEHKLRESEERFRLLVEDVKDYAIFMLAPDGAVASWNAGAERLKGYRAEEVVGEHISRFYLPEDVSAGMPRRELEVAAAEGRLAFEGWRVRKDGSRFWASVVLTAIRDQAGNLRGFGKVTRDYTDRKRAEEDVLRSRQGLSRLAEASLLVVRQADLEGMLQAISEAALALTGARIATCGHGYVNGQFIIGGAAQAPGAPACPPGKMFLMENGGVHMDLVEGADAIRLTDAELRAHPRWWGLPEEHVPMRGLLGVRLVDRQGQTSGMLLVTDKEQGDFTEEDESLLRQLATMASLASQHVEARISLEESDRQKDRFLAMLSHELRNPLAPIRNSLYVLRRAAPGGEQAVRAQAVIDRQVVHLTRLVDDLLDVTRVSRGKIQLQRVRMDLCDVVYRAIEDHRSSFAQNGLGLQLTLPQVPLWIDGDRTRVAQVIGNLLHNSAKFTQPGGKVTVSVEGNADLRQAIVRVRDTGVGIGPEMLPRVFEAFAQADTTLDRSKGGLGLGLALVKGLVEMHGGTVSVESEGPGKGAGFTIRFPLEAAELAAGPLRAALGRSDPRRVLVIEDSVDAADSLRELLEFGEHTVEVAYSGVAGIEKAREFLPDVVLCDIGLPGMDGYEVARAMRADPALRETTLVALTGYAAPEDIARSREAGFDSHLAKPPTLEKIEEALALRRASGRREPGKQ